MPQKYGPKRHSTRRKRGFRRRDLGHRHKFSEETKEKWKRQRKERKEAFKRMRFAAVADIKCPLPKSRETLKRYVFIYNWYFRCYEWYQNARVALENTKDKFKVTEQTIRKAMKIVQYLQDKNAQTPLQ